MSKRGSKRKPELDLETGRDAYTAFAAAANAVSALYTAGVRAEQECARKTSKQLLVSFLSLSAVAPCCWSGASSPTYHSSRAVRPLGQKGGRERMTEAHAPRWRNARRSIRCSRQQRSGAAPRRADNRTDSIARLPLCVTQPARRAVSAAIALFVCCLSPSWRPIVGPPRC